MMSVAGPSNANVAAAAHDDDDGSESRYTEEEIIAELKDMGYDNVSDEQIAQLKQGMREFSHIFCVGEGVLIALHTCFRRRNI